VKWLAAQLVLYRGDDFRVAVTDVEDAEATQTVDIVTSVEIAVGVRTGIGPLDDRAGLSNVAGLAVFQKARVYMVAKRLNRLFGDPARLLRVWIGTCDKR